MILEKTERLNLPLLPTRKRKLKGSIAPKSLVKKYCEIMRVPVKSCTPLWHRNFLNYFNGLYALLDYPLLNKSGERLVIHMEHSDIHCCFYNGVAFNVSLLHGHDKKDSEAYYRADKIQLVNLVDESG